MPTRNISLTKQQDAFVEEIVRSGEYQNASEAMRAAVRALQLRRREDALRLERLRAELQLGIDDLERGNYIELDSNDLRSYVMALARKPKRARSRHRQQRR
jgi:antitoxin ParD1/3/4